MRKPLSPREKEQRLEAGARLLAEKEYFQAHEAFEDLWLAATQQTEREVWQGMAQVAAALVKHQRGEPSSAITLLAKARKRLTGNGLLKDAGADLASYLDGLAGPVTCERELADTSLAPGLLSRLRSLLGGRATGGNLS